jgi:hypothetical protein
MTVWFGGLAQNDNEFFTGSVFTGSFEMTV